MSKKYEIVLTSDHALYYTIGLLLKQVQEMGHGTIEFDGKVVIHGGQIRDVSLSEKTKGIRRFRVPDDKTNIPDYGGLT